FQRQLAETMCMQADFVWVEGRHQEYSRGNANVGFNPATGLNYPFSNAATRPYPNFGTIGMRSMSGESTFHALETAFTKRFSDRWQASATYTLSVLRTCDPLPWLVTFPVAPDLGGECGLGASGSYDAADQRHRAVFNGIWDLTHGLQLSGLYFYGSGYRFTTTYGGDLRDTGGLVNPRLRPNGTIVPRNNFVGR